MPLIANVLHISDTHFSPSLLETGRRLKKLKILPGPKTHAFGKVDALSIKVRQLAREKGKVDLFVISGDVTTDGGPKSMATALKFLEEDKGVYLGRPPSLKTLGLGAKARNRIVVPGNHDRYAGAYKWPPRQQPTDALEQTFGITQNYPYVVAFRQPGQSDSGPAVVFFVFDTTLTDLGDRDSFLDRIATGRFEIAQGEWLRETSAELARTGQVPDLSGATLSVDYESCIRIAVLHHHPVERERDDTDAITLANSIDFTTMENSGSFVEACFDTGIDFVLFGHQHLKYNGRLVPKPRPGWTPPKRASAIHFFCCPSTTEFETHEDEEKRNGFYFFSFGDRHFEVDTFAWEKDLRTFDRVATIVEQYPRMTTIRTAKDTAIGSAQASGGK